MKTIQAAACCLLLTVSSAFAAPTPDRLDAARKLADTMDLKAQMAAGFNAMLPVVDQQAATLNLDAAGKQELLNVFKTWFLEDLDQEKMMNEVIVLYAETFTEAELNELNTFYSSPTGKKILSTLPVIMQKGAQLGMQEAQSKQHLLMERLKAFRESRATR